MANLTMERDDKFIFDNLDGADTYLSQADTTNIWREVIQGQEVESVEIKGTSTKRAAILRSATRNWIGIPLDLTGDAIQTAIDEVDGGGGGVVHVPTGVYAVSSSIKMYSNIVLQGCGSRTILSGPAGGLDEPVIRNENESSSKSFWAIRDLGVNNISYTKSGGVGIRLAKMSAGLLANVQIYNAQTAIEISDDSSYNTITNVYIDVASVGIDLHIDNSNKPYAIRALGVKIGNAAIGIQVQDGTDCSFQGCSIEGGGTLAVSKGIKLMGTAKSIRILCPRIENPGTASGYGISLEGNATENMIVDPYIENMSVEYQDSCANKTNIYLGQRTDGSSNKYQHLYLGSRQIYEFNNVLYFRRQNDYDYADLYMNAISLRNNCLLVGSSSQLNVRNMADTDYVASRVGRLNVRDNDLEVTNAGNGFILVGDNDYRYRLRIDNNDNLYAVPIV